MKRQSQSTIVIVATILRSDLGIAQDFCVGPPQRIVGGDINEGDAFAHEVAIDDDTAIASSRNVSGRQPEHGYAAYVFQRGPDGPWVDVKKLTARDGVLANDFANSGIAIDGD